MYILPIRKTGVLTLQGYGVRVSIAQGHLVLEDGIGPDRRILRLPRVGHGLKRLIIIGSDGFVSLSALRWLADQDAAFILLERDGKVITVTGPVRTSDARLRRAQALSLHNGTALESAKELIAVKLAGQETLVRDKLKDSTTADVIARFRERLSAAEKLDAISLLEAHAAVSYWSAWNTLPINFPRQDMKRVPEHWRTFGTRKSSLTSSSRLAVTPPNAILNYCYALLQSETRLAASALGLDPGIGMLHVDTPNRDSLACDIMETVRPALDAWLLDWITQEPLRRSWFFETATGNCRLMGDFANRLSETAPTWGKLVAPYAERVASKLFISTSSSKFAYRPGTPLTQQHRREAKGRPSLPFVRKLKPDTICRDCGTQVRRGVRFCSKCAVTVTDENFDAGRKNAQQPASLAKRSATQRLHQQAIQNWKASHLPAWLTREVYLKEVQPALANVAKSKICSALRVSEPYSSDIQEGKRIPHQRHWQTLARLIGFSRSFGSSR